MLVADFGIAEFTQDDLYTAVETHTGERLANFLYAAPEQRERGKTVDRRADIYALGLMLNELFTGQVLQGTAFTKIKDRAPPYEYLDEIVDRMVRQLPADRFSTIDEIKKELIARKQVFVSRQKVDVLSKQVIPEGTIDDPLVREPIGIASVDYQPGRLIVTLDKPPTHEWIMVFQQMTGVLYFMGREPQRVTFDKSMAHVPTSEQQAASQLTYFKQWVEKANTDYKQYVQRNLDARLQAERDAIAAKLAQEIERQRVLGTLKL